MELKVIIDDSVNPIYRVMIRSYTQNLQIDLAEMGLRRRHGGQRASDGQSRQHHPVAADQHDQSQANVIEVTVDPETGESAGIPKCAGYSTAVR